MPTAYTRAPKRSLKQMLARRTGGALGPGPSNVPTRGQRASRRIAAPTRDQAMMQRANQLTQRRRTLRGPRP